LGGWRGGAERGVEREKRAAWLEAEAKSKASGRGELGGGRGGAWKGRAGGGTHSGHELAGGTIDSEVKVERLGRGRREAGGTTRKNLFFILFYRERFLEVRIWR
jgi:hypothetical protein